MKSTFKLWTTGDDPSLVPWQQLAAMDINDFPWPWSEQDWLELATNGRHYLLLWDEEKGFALWDLDGSPAAYLLKVLIFPLSRGQGFGAQIMLSAENYFTEQGYTSGLLEVQWDNEAAMALYESLGWRELRRIRGFYRDGSDALSMQKIF